MPPHGDFLDTDNLKTVKAWDPLVRACHWSLVAAFFVAYFTDDDLMTLHAWAGYLVGLIVVLRVLWGLVGPKYARFSDFIFGPWKVWGYLVDLVNFRAERYIGHTPAGGAMTVALLMGLAATVWSGLETYAVEENAGPLASSRVVGSAQAKALPSAPTLLASSEDEHEEGEESEREHNDGEGDEFWEDVHEILANLMLTLVIIHISSVGFTSVVHRENLARAMITGKKRAP